MEYTQPQISDYGSIEQLTAATGFAGDDDGGAKNARPAQPHHTSP
jgi:hypothetical protein